MSARSGIRPCAVAARARAAGRVQPAVMSSPESRTTVVVADDHPLYRAGLVDAIAERPDLELVAECAGGRDAVEQIVARRPDVALLDMRMRDLDGMAVIGEVARAGLRTRVIFLS